jgi:hypothetical protein
MTVIMKSEVISTGSSLSFAVPVKIAILRLNLTVNNS